MTATVLLLGVLLLPYCLGRIISQDVPPSLAPLDTKSQHKEIYYPRGAKWEKKGKGTDLGSSEHIQEFGPEKKSHKSMGDKKSLKKA